MTIETSEVGRTWTPQVSHITGNHAVPLMVPAQGGMWVSVSDYLAATARADRAEAALQHSAQRCAECDCRKGGSDCTWIATPADSSALLEAELADLRASLPGLLAEAVAAPVILDDHRPHAVGPVVCGRCQCSWISVRPVGVIYCECPKCGAMFGASFMTHMDAFADHIGLECCGQVDGSGVCSAPACIRGAALKGVDTIRLAYFLEHPE